jgi:radical SAM superfamily enzyme YgiQ (UPF0313 family)
VNPPIHDFAAYDFWLRPYGLLTVAGQLRGQADFCFFDYLDRRQGDCGFGIADCGLASGDSSNPQSSIRNPQSDSWGRGPFPFERIPNPEPLKDVPRYFRRFGRHRAAFQEYLRRHAPFDYAFVQTVMTYWYPGVAEVIEDIRRACPEARIVLGGDYATLCTEHARRLGADLVVVGSGLQPLWQLLGVISDAEQPALWEVYESLWIGAIKLSDGCPFRCSYCSVPRVYAGFTPRSLGRAMAELELLAARGAKDVAFYDDALLFDAERVLTPFLREVIRWGIRVNLHTPNALNARFVTAELADLMVQAGFKTFYLGFESASQQWQQCTGGKVLSQELAQSVKYLLAAGADPTNVTAYQILGHPDSDLQELEASMRFVHSLGIRGMLADFSPIPGTADGETCRRWVDMNEPLMHNKTAFPIIRLGFDEVNRLKDLQRQLNRDLRA